MVQQVSFNVGTLPQVQKAFRKVRDAGCEGISPICHGNAWSVYFQDPEGNRIEMFCDTPWYVPQPLGFKIDLDKPADELYRRDRGLLPRARGVQADRGMAGRDRRKRSRPNSKLADDPRPDPRFPERASMPATSHGNIIRRSFR